MQEYLTDLNATQAAIRAGYSAKTAEQKGYQLIQKSSVQQAIQEAQADRSQRTEVTADWVVQRLREEAGPGGISPAARVRALELLGKHLGMFPDKHEHTGPRGGAIPHQMTHEAKPDAAQWLDRYAALLRGPAPRDATGSLAGNGQEQPVDTPHANGEAGGVPH